MSLKSSFTIRLALPSKTLLITLNLRVYNSENLMKSSLYYMIKPFLIKEMVDQLRSRQKIWLHIKNEKLRLNLHPHTKSSGLTIL